MDYPELVSLCSIMNDEERLDLYTCDNRYNRAELCYSDTCRDITTGNAKALNGHLPFKKGRYAVTFLSVGGRYTEMDVTYR